MHHLSGYASIGTMVQRQLYGVWAFSCMIWCVEISPLKRMNKYGKKRVQIFLAKPENEVWILTYIKNILNDHYCFFSSNANITFRTRVSADCRDLIQSCLKRSPSSRIPLEKILNHRWVTSNATPCGPLSPNGTPNEGIPPRGPPPQRSLVHARASLLGDFSDLAPLTGEFWFLLRKCYDFQCILSQDATPMSCSLAAVNKTLVKDFHTVWILIILKYFSCHCSNLSTYTS